MSSAANPAAARTLLLVLEYDGTNFSGWQAQTGTALRTVQGELEGVLSRVLQETVRVAAAGRTDAGCHAAGQVASFRTRSALALPRLARALTGLLPSDVGVRSMAEVPVEFHARYAAVERRYHYRLLDRPSPLGSRFGWWPWMKLDPEALNAAFAPLVGDHDFRAFAGRDPSRDQGSHGRCRVSRLAFVRSDEGVRLEVHANRFLYHMVRNLVGTATALVKGTRRAEDLPGILASCDRRRAGPTAPPKGLCLMEVVYPEHLAPLGDIVDALGRSSA